MALQTAFFVGKRLRLPVGPLAALRTTKLFAPVSIFVSVRESRLRMMSFRSDSVSASSMRRGSSLRRTEARKEQNTCPRMSASLWRYAGRVLGRDLAARNRCSTRRRFLYCRATRAAGALLLRMPSSASLPALFWRSRPPYLVLVLRWRLTRETARGKRRIRPTSLTSGGAGTFPANNDRTRVLYSIAGGNS